MLESVVRDQHTTTYVDQFESLQWLDVGKRVVFVLEDTIYEIVPATAEDPRDSR